jgi:hypothetical protein
MSIPASRRRARYRVPVLRLERSELPIARLPSRFLPPAIGSCITAFGCGQALLDQFHCHIVSDESAEKLYEPHQRGLDGFGGRDIVVRHDALGDSLNVGLRSGSQLDFRQCRVLAARACQRTCEESVTAVGTNPPRELPVKIVARQTGGTSARAALRIPGVSVDQAAHDLSRRRLVTRQRPITPEKDSLQHRDYGDFRYCTSEVLSLRNARARAVVKCVSSPSSRRAVAEARSLRH